jgi:hypothetical protein
MINGRRPELVVLIVQDAMTVAAGHWIVRKLVISIICRGRLAGGGERACARACMAATRLAGCACGPLCFVWSCVDLDTTRP